MLLNVTTVELLLEMEIQCFAVLDAEIENKMCGDVYF